jgi:branched-chain amino acid transport system ATP-binding protein
VDKIGNAGAGMSNDIGGKHRGAFARNDKIILQVKRANMSFGDFRVLQGVNFEVKEGEIFGIAGPNGAGKTTLFNVIAGKLKGSGEINFGGKNVIGFRPYRICHMGIARTFQTPILFSTISVFENVRVGSHFGFSPVRSKNAIRETINEVLDSMGLKGKENTIVSSLNLFDKKRVMLAGALATKPKLLLLDEPVGGLSPIEIRRFVELIQRLNKEYRLTVIIIEHLMQVINRICHRLMILHNGQEICIGPPEEVANNNEVMKVYLGEKHA